MIAGIGLDVIAIDRIQKKVSNDQHFTEKIFSKAEINYCKTKKNAAQHYAVRFAAKEAFLKAAGVGLMYSFNLSQIEVINDQSGKPCLYLQGDFEKLRLKNNWKTIHVSLSHTKTDASAIVIIEQ